MREEGAATLTAGQAAAAASGRKGMMPLEGRDGRSRPFLDYVLSALADAGYGEVALVVAPEGESPDPMRAYYGGAGHPERLRLTFVVQPEPLGTANALLAAADWIAGRPFVVLNADNLYDRRDLRALREASGPALPVYTRDGLVEESGIPADRVGAFALLEVQDGRLLDIVEKPGADAVAQAGGQALVSMNCWRGDEAILSACRDVPRSARGEFELPGAIRLALTRGVPIVAIPAVGPVLDLSRRIDVADVARRIAAYEAAP